MGGIRQRAENAEKPTSRVTQFLSNRKKKHTHTHIHQLLPLEFSVHIISTSIPANFGVLFPAEFAALEAFLHFASLFCMAMQLGI